MNSPFTGFSRDSSSATGAALVSAGAGAAIHAGAPTAATATALRNPTDFSGSPGKRQKPQAGNLLPPARDVGQDEGTFTLVNDGHLVIRAIYPPPGTSCTVSVSPRRT